MGDLIVTLPVLRALRVSYPAARLTLAGDPRWRFLAEGMDPVLCDAFEDATSARWALLLDAPGATDRAWLRQFDLAYLCASDPDGSLHALFAELGFSESPTSGAHRRVVWCAPKPVDCLAAEHFGRPLSAFGLGPVARRVDLAVPQALRESMRARAGLVDVTIHPGSSNPRRNEPWAFWSETARHLRAAGLRIAWAAGYAEEHLIPLVRAEASSAREFLLEGAAVEQLASLLSLAVVHLGHDTGATHLAAALGLRVHAVFSLSAAEVWAPPGSLVQVWRRGRVTPALLAEAVCAAPELRVQARRSGAPSLN